jgi:hypothetical protein
MSCKEAASCLGPVAMRGGLSRHYRLIRAARIAIMPVAAAIAKYFCGKARK